MRLNRFWMVCLSACLAGAASGAARAEGSGEARARQTAHRGKAVDFSSLNEAGEPARIASPVPYFPIAPDTEFKRHVVRLGDGDGDGGAAGSGGLELVYSNVNGRFVQPLRASDLLADDLTLTSQPGCKLRQYTFQVTGRADPGGIGGPFQVNFALYNTCPAASGVVISGTNGSESFPDDSPRTVTVDIAGDVALTRSTVWLAVRFNRNNCGVVLGTPPLEGFSGDVYDFPRLHCQGNLGGFPQAPHASFNAQVFADAACSPGGAIGPGFVGYRNLDPFPPGHAFGAGTRFADDIQMPFTRCDLVGYEIGVKGTAAYSVQLYRSSAGLPSTPIANTDFSFIAVGNEAQIFHFAIDPPISLTGASPGIQLWMALRPNSVTGKWIRTESIGQVGSTTESAAVDTNTEPGGAPIWEIQFPDPPNFHGFYAVLLCDGQPPVGACCDMLVRDSENESVCRTVPEMNCPFPPRNSTLRPGWREGIPCRVCDGGCTDGLSCDTDSDCVGGPDGICFDNICSGGCNDLAPCQTDEDCAGATDGTCVDNEPFAPDPPCGKSACCTPQDTCINLTEHECEAVEPPFRERQWQRGQYCGRQGQRCPDSACLGRIGSCTEERDRLCNGGDAAGALCSNDNECRGRCIANICIGGCNDGLPCTFNSDCNCDGTCSDADPNNPVCISGAREGEFCDPVRGDRDCMEAYCERFPGCNDPDCCTAVCDFAPDFPLFTEFCCQTEWDLQCAEIARTADIPECQFLPDTNDTCAPTVRTDGAALLEIGSSGLGGGKSTPRAGVARNGPPDPGYCCHQGFRVCEGGCTPGAECMVDTDCSGAAAGTCGENDFCQGGCNDGQMCQGDEDCPGAAAGTCALPSTPEPNTTGHGTHWYRVAIPPAATPEEPDTVSLEFDTCNSPGSPATWDSLIQVHSIVDSDRGACIGLGRCADTTVCSVGVGDCADGSTCQTQTLPCSVEAQDCPLNAVCEFDLTAACARQTSLASIACNDDAPDGCGDPTNRGRLSKVCIDGLRKGDTYIVMVGAKEAENVVDYRLRVTSTSSCPASGRPANDSCPNAAPFPFHPTIQGSREFDLTEAAWDCEPGEASCPSMQNDIWWQYRPAFNGRVTLEACGPDNQSTPDTCLAIYEGCECPPLLDVPETCQCLNLNNPQCQEGSRIDADLIGGQCYTIRLSDNRGTRGAGTLTGQFELDDCNGNGIADNCEISCGEPGGLCDIAGCGTKGDCQPNGFPDECDIPISQGGHCDPSVRPDCSTDFNGDGRPDECPNCPPGVVEYLDPQDGVVAAGYPTSLGGSCTAAGISTFVATAGEDADPLCWRVCETDDTGSPNFVTKAVEDPPGTYTIMLGRPLTPGQCTTINYRDNDDVNHVATFTALPGDVNGDRITNLDDLTFLVDVLMGSEIAPWGAYSSDIDGNGVSVFPDMLGLVDLLDGNGPCFTRWNGAGAPSCDACLPAR